MQVIESLGPHIDPKCSTVPPLRLFHLAIVDVTSEKSLVPLSALPKIALGCPIHHNESVSIQEHIPTLSPPPYPHRHPDLGIREIPWRLHLRQGGYLPQRPSIFL